MLAGSEAREGVTESGNLPRSAITGSGSFSGLVYGSICSGIEAATVGWHPLGWRPAFFSEIEKFPRAVLQHHYPHVPLHGDFTTIQAGDYEPIDLLVGGTPCQDFSVAGLRKGVDGQRGQLTFEYAELAKRLRPKWFCWENVYGVFSLNEGRDFGAVIACFAGYPLGCAFATPADGWGNTGVVPAASPDSYGIAWRVLDSQYFGVPQRRRRVIVVGYLGDWRPAAAVLFERACLRWNPDPREAARQDVAGTLSASLERCSADDAERGTLIAGTLEASASRSRGAGTSPGQIVSGALQANGKAAGSATQQDAEAGMLIPVPFDLAQITSKTNRSTAEPGAPAGTLSKLSQPHVAYSIMPMQSGTNFKARETDVAQPLMAGGPVGGNQGGDYIVQTVTGADVTHALNTANGGKMSSEDGTGRGVPLVSAYRTSPNCGAWNTGDRVDALTTATDPNSHLIAEQVRISCGCGHVFVATDINACCPSCGKVSSAQVTYGFSCKDHGADAGDIAPTLRAMGHADSHANAGGQLAVAFQTRVARNGRGSASEVVPALNGADAGATSDMRPCVATTSAVRRLTPLECERLQAFPDHYTMIPFRSRRVDADEAAYLLRANIPGIKVYERKGKLFTNAAADGPRYKALGNTKTTTVVRWVGERIAMVEQMLRGMA